MEINELIQKLSGRKIIIYGTGYAAQNFFTGLVFRKLDAGVVCFMRTKVTDGERAFCGKKVISIDELGAMDRDALICIAVHEANYKEIVLMLESRGIEQYIWVHPYIFELALGNMLERGVWLPVGKILHAQDKNNYLIAIRYLAIENYFSENNCGFSIYGKAIRMQCEKSTADKRIVSFKMLIKSWFENGYREGYPILLDEKLRLIDGTHRFSLALYERRKNICCNILPASDHYETVEKEADRMPEGLLKLAGYTEEELTLIKQKQEMLWKCGKGEYGK